MHVQQHITIMHATVLSLLIIREPRVPSWFSRKQSMHDTKPTLLQRLHIRIYIHMCMHALIHRTANTRGRPVFWPVPFRWPNRGAEQPNSLRFRSRAPTKQAAAASRTICMPLFPLRDPLVSHRAEKRKASDALRRRFPQLLSLLLLCATSRDRSGVLQKFPLTRYLPRAPDARHASTSTAAEDPRHP